MPGRWWISALSIWPGLPQIWSGQEVMGLILATVFAATVNLAIITRLIWIDLVSHGLSTFLTALAVGTWVAAFAYTLWWVWRCHPERHKIEIDQLYHEASVLYLQGRWVESRRRLERILAMDETDVDALMHLGTLLMRIDQPEQARRAFRQCLELENGAKWRWEIGQALSKLGDR